MPRPLVVEGETGPVVPEPAEPALVFGPAHPGGGRRLARVARPVGGAERVAGEDVLDVHQQQFLVLLLVVQPELDQFAGFRPGPVGKRLEQPGHRLVDMGAIGDDLGHRRARQQAPVRTGVPVPHPFVIGVEQVSERGIERRVCRQMRSQDEGLEEPGHMSEMPFRRADVGHRLHLLVFRRERRSEFFAQRPDFAVPAREAPPRRLMVFGMHE